MGLVDLSAMPNALLNKGLDMYLVSIYMSIYEQTRADVDLESSIRRIANSGSTQLRKLPSFTKPLRPR